MKKQFTDKMEKLQQEYNRLRRILDAARTIKQVFSLLPDEAKDEAIALLENEDEAGLKLLMKDA